MPSHQAIEARSLEMHRLIAEKIRRDPSLFAKVKANLDRWQDQIDPRARPYLDEWQRLADAGVNRMLEVATEDSEYARAMRQSTPFVGILSNDERYSLIKRFRGHET